MDSIISQLGAPATTTSTVTVTSTPGLVLPLRARYSPETVERICAAIRDHGLSDARAAMQAGVHPQTLHRWHRQHFELREHLRAARAAFEQNHRAQPAGSTSFALSIIGALATPRSTQSHPVDQSSESPEPIPPPQTSHSPSPTQPPPLPLSSSSDSEPEPAPARPLPPIPPAPVELTPELARDMYEKIRRYGFADTRAALLCGVSRTVIHRWKKANPDLVEFLEAARTEYMAKRLGEVETAETPTGLHDWRASMALLERTFPHEYGRHAAKSPPPAEPAEPFDHTQMNFSGEITLAHMLELQRRHRISLGAGTPEDHNPGPDFWRTVQR